MASSTNRLDTNAHSVPIKHTSTHAPTTCNDTCAFTTSTKIATIHCYATYWPSAPKARIEAGGVVIGRNIRSVRRTGTDFEDDDL